MKENILELNKLSKKIGNKSIIDNVSIEVKKGEIFGLVGPNGSGKTTLIRMIVGLISKSEGQIKFNGEDVSNNINKVLDKIGVIIENPDMYPYLSGYMNLYLFSKMSLNDIDKERVDLILKKCGLDEVKFNKVKTYSLGMRQRLGIAQALVHDPNLIILDEPTNGLDPSGILELRDYLKELKSSGKSIVISSHLLSEMQLICDRAAFLEKGKVVKVVDLNNKTSLFNYKEFIVDKAEEAAHILEKNSIEYKYINEENIQISIDQEAIPDIITLLNNSGVRVYYIKDLVVQLEEEYFNIKQVEGLA